MRESDRVEWMAVVAVAGGVRVQQLASLTSRDLQLADRGARGQAERARERVRGAVEGM